MYWSYYLLIFYEHYALSRKTSFWTWWSKPYHQYHYYCYRNLHAALLRYYFPEDVQSIKTRVNSFLLPFLQAWEALSLILTHRVWPDPRSFWKVLSQVSLSLLQATTVSHPAGDTSLWLDPFLKGCTGKGKGIEDYALNLLHPEPPIISFAWHFFTWEAISPLNGILAFEVL